MNTCKTCKYYLGIKGDECCATQFGMKINIKSNCAMIDKIIDFTPDPYIIQSTNGVRVAFKETNCCPLFEQKTEEETKNDVPMPFDKPDYANVDFSEPRPSKYSYHPTYMHADKDKKEKEVCMDSGEEVENDDIPF